MKQKFLIFLLLLIKIYIFSDESNDNSKSINFKIGFSQIPISNRLNFYDIYGYEITKDENKKIIDIELYNDNYRFINFYYDNLLNFDSSISFLFVIDKKINSKLSLGFINLTGCSFYIPIHGFMISLFSNSGIRIINGSKKIKLLNEISINFIFDIPIYPINEHQSSSGKSTSSSGGVITNREYSENYYIYSFFNFISGPYYKIGFTTSKNKFCFEFLGFVGSTFGFSLFNYRIKQIYLYNTYINAIILGVELRFIYQRNYIKK